jgi:hypothetical protein
MILSIISVRKDKEINTISMHNGYGHTGYWIGSTLCDDEVLVLCSNCSYSCDWNLRIDILVEIQICPFINIIIF